MPNEIKTTAAKVSQPGRRRAEYACVVITTSWRRLGRA
jgi:hypothetical protein